ncbi:hypothetical protein SAMN02745121_07661 [Nannocystis exedens]|uniref:Uncharacterized protein n=2 Tax=Nannocystis exedens TaxID=54 RepID=A0A1I2H4G6_9BACT|nr:hypothetical protein NAEX_00099 [Nannocystis exedens]SFF23686.1 hypothetical protein SAMN02745121_07661 [Nannocystis exedens]
MPEPVCGDGLAEAGETCDGTDLGGKKCTDFPNFGGGILQCNPNCQAYDLAGCCKLAGQGCSNGGQCCSGSCVLFNCK